MKQFRNDFDVVVVGGGHAGLEAAQAAARQGARIALITLDPKALGRMSCNPAIGGLAKGQMVREMDVLGGLMALAADQAGIQFKMLNRSKGRSVWSPRAQVDKRRYERLINRWVFSLKGLTVIKGEVVNLVVKQGHIRGVILRGGPTLHCSSVVLTCGTFLNGRIHIGDRKIHAGRMGEPHVTGITEALVSLGFKAGRLKTGTPPRLMRNTIDWSRTTVVSGDAEPTPFSYRTRNFNPPNVPCHTVRTGPDCHDIIQQNLTSSPMFSGDILATGPRYCPSIEDKIHRFAHQEFHTLFLEPEWVGADQIYTNGFSTSLPEKVQVAALRCLPGLERVEFLRPGYAIEYDFFPPAQLRASLETKEIDGLFFAGQINGTSGYEEAAAQGLLAGINSAAYVFSREPVTLGRDEAYIGVLIDDLITKDTLEPYRMFTSRAEYRLLLRYTNADRRLLNKAQQHNLLPESVCATLQKKLSLTDQGLSALNRSLSPDDINKALLDNDESPISQRQPAHKLLKRPGLGIDHLPVSLFHLLDTDGIEPFLIKEVFSEVETTIKYAGYIERQHRHIEHTQALENQRFPKDVDYRQISSLSLEAREKLAFVRPETFGQAQRVSGVSPADIAVLSVFFSRPQ